MTKKERLGRWILLAALFGGVATTTFSGNARAQTVIGKQCTNCYRSVPVVSQVGQSCPYCGAYWGSEQTNYVPGGGDVNSLPGVWPGGVPRPMNSDERMAFYQAMIQQQMIQRQMVLDQIAEQKRQAKRQVLAERCQKLREEDVAKREEIYRRLGEKRELHRQNYNPEQQADRHLAAAVDCEDDGNLRAAVAYYRLVARTAPKSAAATQASDALARLGAE